MQGSPTKKSFLKIIPDPPIRFGCPNQVKLFLPEKILGEDFDVAKCCWLGLYMKRTGSIASRIWKLMPPKTIDVLLNRLFEQAKQSNSKRGSPAEPLILDNMNDSGAQQFTGFSAG